MTQPSKVQVAEADDVRAVRRMPAPAPWSPERVAEIRTPSQPRGRMLGEQGPDQGYALHLAGAFENSLTLEEGESAEDAVSGCVAVAMARASLFGRAPVAADLALAFTLFGYLGDAPEELVKERAGWFRGCAHDYWGQMAVRDRVRTSTLRCTPESVRDRLSEWQDLLIP